LSSPGLFLLTSGLSSFGFFCGFVFLSSFVFLSDSVFLSRFVFISRFVLRSRFVFGETTGCFVFGFGGGLSFGLSPNVALVGGLKLFGTGLGASFHFRRGVLV